MAAHLDPQPNSATFPASPAQYAALQAGLKANSKVSRLEFTADGGSASVENVDFAWAYDGTAALTVTIVKKHGFFAGLIPNETIFDELAGQLKTLT